MAFFEVVVCDVGEHCVPGLMGVGVDASAGAGVAGLSEFERTPLADCCGWESGSPEMAEDVSFPGVDVI